LILFTVKVPGLWAMRVQGCWIYATMTFCAARLLGQRPYCNFLGMSAPEEGTKAGIPYFTFLSDSIYHLKIALLTESLPSAMAKSTALQSNLDVDFVISYRFAKTGMFVCMAG
jgi:hypothetical protein